jgi:hypothetical protein
MAGSTDLQYEEKDLAKLALPGTQVTRITDTLWRASRGDGPSYLFSTDPAIFAAQSRWETDCSPLGEGSQFVVFAATVCEQQRVPRESPQLYFVCSDSARLEILRSTVPPVPGCIYIQGKSGQAELHYPPKAVDCLRASYPECYPVVEAHGFQLQVGQVRTEAGRP